MRLPDRDCPSYGRADDRGRRRAYAEEVLRALPDGITVLERPLAVVGPPTSKGRQHWKLAVLMLRPGA